MIVDDSKFMRSLIRDSLEHGGHHVIAETDNGIDAVTIYGQAMPDFVTLDVTMWGQDGIEAAKKIKNIDPKAKIIIVSALSKNTIDLIEPNINISACITKPFDKSELLDTISKIL
jgi:two-component system chemotaxis response regulator CheY